MKEQYKPYITIQILPILNQRLYFHSQHMHSQDAELSYKLIKMKNSVRRGFIKQAITVRVKNKPISKHFHKRCQENCYEHRFSLRKLGLDECNQLNKDIPDIAFHFCPIENHIMKAVQGGIPRWSFDRKADTPCFVPFFQGFTEMDEAICRAKFEKQKANAQLFFQEQSKQNTDVEASIQNVNQQVLSHRKKCEVNFEQLQSMFNKK